MSFSEAIKLQVKEKALFRCCRCQRIGVEIHHIVPQEDGGPDTVENAAPLCGSCHNDVGANREKQKEIRQMRDLHYQRCAQVPLIDSHTIADINGRLENAASKEDIARAVDRIQAMLSGIMRSGGTPAAQASAIGVALTTATSSVSMTPFMIEIRMCGSCGREFDDYGDHRCPHCGTVL